MRQAGDVEHVRIMEDSEGRSRVCQPQSVSQLVVGVCGDDGCVVVGYVCRCLFCSLLIDWMSWDASLYAHLD